MHQPTARCHGCLLLSWFPGHASALPCVSNPQELLHATSLPYPFRHGSSFSASCMLTSLSFTAVIFHTACATVILCPKFSCLCASRKCPTFTTELSCNQQVSCRLMGRRLVHESFSRLYVTTDVISCTVLSVASLFHFFHAHHVFVLVLTSHVQVFLLKSLLPLAELYKNRLLYIPH